MSSNDSRVWFAVALHCGHDRRGRSTRSDGSPFPDDFKTIGEAYASRALPWQEASITAGSYLVPRYYDRLALSETGREVVSLGELERQGELLLKKGHEVGSEAYGTGDIPFVRTSDINNYEISIDPTKGVSEDIYERYRVSQNLRSGDILMINDGRYRIGRTAILTENTVRCVVQSHIRILSLAEGARFNPFELLYLLNLPGVQHQIRNLVFVQSTLGSLGSRVREIKIPLPDQQSDWSSRIERFRALIEGRAKLLRDLSQFEHDGLEL
jgi:type I restriction enzyme M protein